MPRRVHAPESDDGMLANVADGLEHSEEVMALLKVGFDPKHSPKVVNWWKQLAMLPINDSLPLDISSKSNLAHGFTGEDTHKAILSATYVRVHVRRLGPVQYKMFGSGPGVPLQQTFDKDALVDAMLEFLGLGYFRVPFDNSKSVPERGRGNAGSKRSSGGSRLDQSGARSR